MSEPRLDPRQTAVVVIDIQKGILMLPCEPHSTADVAANCVRLVEAARRTGAKPVLVHVGPSPDGADALQPEADDPLRRPEHLPPDWSELLPDFRVQSSDLVILKRHWGAFYGTELDLQLRRRGLKTIVLCGIATEFGVESTARDAFERGYEQVFAADAMTGRAVSSYNNSVERIFPRFGRVRTTNEIIAALEAGAGST